ncbi:MAG: 50S ribosomal protein L21 [Elusimicrobia bacterium CG06_land_8_20_14_3_00_38_11]|nr:MAG: 50S ribosomal protein L21 [Elusimicrobia bacterium CG06_land_8_20_14_3_00_38_11]
MYAIIEASGKQYKVEEGKTVKIDKLSQKIGDTVEFKSIFTSDKGKKISTDSTKVIGKVVGNIKDKKIIVFKKRPKKGYKKTIGHRQNYTEVEITKIG